MPKTNSTRALTSICEGEHFVQLYKTDRELINNMKSFIGGGIREGDPCIVIASKTHQEDLDKQLTKAGINISAAKESGMYICLDAHETLSKFMDGSMPNPQRFRAVLGSMLHKFFGNGSTIRAYGEMVAILWDQGNQEAALSLEHLWNELAQEHSFTLFCAYPKSHFREDVDETRVSQLHSTAITAN